MENVNKKTSTRLDFQNLMPDSQNVVHPTGNELLENPINE